MTAIGAMALTAGVACASPYQSMSLDLVNDGSEGRTYRLYVGLDAGARVDAVYGNAQGALSIYAGNGATMYQDAAGGATSQSINSAFFQFVPSMEWDSYVSIGALYSDGSPFGANNLNDIGIDWGVWEGGGDLYTDNGSWFVTPDDPQGLEQNGRVFIGQFTLQGGTGTAADLFVQVNLQGKDANGDTWNTIGAPGWPSPGALALLGIGGFVGPRRRRH
ncbi:MAG: hypothetical protein P8M22_12265 [Phycisphaerales bacterium]|nr:hypothetical protein [Phycisphaerales bacterium]